MAKFGGCAVHGALKNSRISWQRERNAGEFVNPHSANHGDGGPPVGMQRIQVGDDFGFVAGPSTLVREGQMDDTAPFTQSFCIRASNSKSVLTISLHDAEPFGGAPVDPMIVFSEHSERRRVVDGTGKVIGEDYWGYLDPEKR
jgi:hypothetical protein